MIEESNTTKNTGNFRTFPIEYDYKCKECGDQGQITKTSSEENIKCPNCGRNMERTEK